MHGDKEVGTPPVSITQLPTEILLTIFSYLQTSDVKYGIAKVCSQWCVLAKDKKLWKNLHFKTTSKGTKVFGRDSWFSTLSFLKSTPELQNVTITQSHSNEELLEILRVLNHHCPNLRHIAFEIDLTGIIRNLPDLVNVFNKVESLQLLLRHCTSQPVVLKTLLEFKKLTKVEFLGAPPNSRGFELFLRSCRNLRHLSVARGEFSKDNFTSLCKEKDKFFTLKINTGQLDEKCLREIKTFPNLRDLMLSDGNPSPEKLLEIGQLEYLRCLHLEEEPTSPVWTSAAQTKFFERGCFHNLKELKLHKSRLNDEGAGEIRRNCPNLLYLEIMTYPQSISCMTEKALVHFLHCKALRHLEVLFDNSEEVDWVYRRRRFFHHECEVDEACSLSLEGLLDCWDEIHIPVD